MRVRRDPAQWASDATALFFTATALVLSITNWRSLYESVAAAATRTDPGIQVSTAQEAAPTVPPPPRPPLPKVVVTQQRVKVDDFVPEDIQLPPDETEATPPGAVLVAQSSPAIDESSRRAPDMDALYAAQLLADIRSRTRVPDSAMYRLRRPSGEVRVRFALTRAGQASSVEVLRSSGSTILDEAALNIVSSGHYPVMPEKAFNGERQHVFAVTIEFRASRSS